MLRVVGLSIVVLFCSSVASAASSSGTLVVQGVVAQRVQIQVAANHEDYRIVSNSKREFSVTKQKLNRYTRLEVSAP
jgi:hypothetical protein